MTVKIITDSGCDLPKDIIDKYNIKLLPLSINVEGKEYKDTVDITPKEIFDGMRNGKVYKTSQYSYGEFMKLFTEIAENKDKCIYIALSSGLSGTYETAIVAKNNILESYDDFELDIIDTKCASGGFGMCVLKAAQLAHEGKEKDEIVETVKRYCENVEHVFTVDNLEYLLRGGRISKTSAVVGELLKIKPILDVDELGKLAPLEKVRGKKKLYKRMIEIIGEKGANLSEQEIGIFHGDDLEAAETIRDLLAKEFGCKDFFINYIGATIGCHSGPGTLAVYFLNKI